MKTRKILSVLLIFAITLTLFVSCEKKITVKYKQFWGFFGESVVGTLYDYSGMAKGDFDALAKTVEEKLAAYHRLFDIYNEYDGIVNLKTLNDNAGGGPMKVDGAIIELLSFAKTMHTETGGRLNVAMGAVLKIWHGCRESGDRIPDMEELTRANAHTDINDLIIDKENSTVEICDPEMSLDVGAVAKGFSVEKVALWLEEEGYSSLVLDVGGNLRAIGEKPDGGGWNAGIRDPFSPFSDSTVYSLSIKDEALVTSGSYFNFYTVGGVRYHHIINNETLMPENYYISVSIKAPSSAMADALSTAIFNMPKDEADEFIKGIDGIFVVFVMPDGKVVTSE